MLLTAKDKEKMISTQKQTNCKKRCGPSSVKKVVKSKPPV